MSDEPYIPGLQRAREALAFMDAYGLPRQLPDTTVLGQISMRELGGLQAAVDQEIDALDSQHALVGSGLSCEVDIEDGNAVLRVKADEISAEPS